VSITTADFRSKITTHILAEKKLSRERITALTAYDYATARLLDQAGVQ
jgi:3-methyl-2-oxobutanoate hydroxymethyltransferase